MSTEVKLCRARHDCLVVGNDHITVPRPVVAAFKEMKEALDDQHVRLHNALAALPSEASERRGT